MDAGINNVIYMELYSGPKMANGRCGKTIDTGTIDRGSTVHLLLTPWHSDMFQLSMGHLQGERHIATARSTK